MQQYPSIPHWQKAPLGRPCLAFDKIDGSNIRAEWSQKRGFSKFGTRQRLLDSSDAQLGPAVTLFEESIADELARVFSARDWKRAGVKSFTVFLEYWGPGSFAGNHFGPEEERQLFLLDVATDRELLSAKELLKRFGHLNLPPLVYEGNFNRELIERVRNGELDLAEGVVAKGGEGKRLWMAKVKTDTWIERLRASGGEAALREEFAGDVPADLLLPAK